MKFDALPIEESERLVSRVSEKHIEDGTTAKVYQKTVGTKVTAVKKFKPTLGEFNQEVSIHQFLGKHPHIIQYLAHDDLNRIIEMEWASKGDLFTFVENNQRDQQRDYPALRAKYLLEFAKALSYLKSKKVVHSDVKLQNVLIHEDNTVKLCDFGMTRKLDTDKDCIETKIIDCTPGNAAPEVLPITSPGVARYSYASDLWSFCIALWIMHSFQLPFSEYTDTTGIAVALHAKTTPEPLWITDKPVRELAVLMWSYRPEDRPDIDTQVIPVLEQAHKTYQPG